MRFHAALAPLCGSHMIDTGMGRELDRRVSHAGVSPRGAGRLLSLHRVCLKQIICAYNSRTCRIGAEINASMHARMTSVRHGQLVLYGVRTAA